MRGKYTFEISAALATVLWEQRASPPAMNSHIVMPVSANSAYGVSPDGTSASRPRNTAKIAVRMSG